MRMLAKVLLLFYLPLVCILTVLNFPYDTDPSLYSGSTGAGVQAQQFYEKAYLPITGDSDVKSGAYVETAKIAGI